MKNLLVFLFFFFTWAIFTTYLIVPCFRWRPTVTCLGPSGSWSAHGGFTQTNWLMWPAYTAGIIQFSILRCLQRNAILCHCLMNCVNCHFVEKIILWLSNERNYRSKKIPRYIICPFYFFNQMKAFSSTIPIWSVGLHTVSNFDRTPCM